MVVLVKAGRMMPRPSSFVLRAMAGAALAVWSGAAGAEAESNEAQGAGDIIITGRGLDLPPAAAAYGTVQIPHDRLQSSASGRIEDVLMSVAGFQQFRRSDSRSANPSAQGVTLRALGGNATSRTLVLLDGVPQADPFFGSVPLSAIDPARLAGVRVSRGGGAGAFGAGAVAGTIELASAGAAELGLASGQVLANDRGETTLSASFAPRLGQGFAVLSGRWDRGEGFWTTPVAKRDAASVPARYQSWSTVLRAAAPLAPGTELQARIAAFADQRTLRFTGADSGSSGQDASLRVVGRGAWAFEALGYVQARDFSNVVISASTFRRTLDQYATPTTGLGGKLELRPPVGRAHVLRLGADWRSTRGTAFETAYNASTGAVTARRSAGGRNSDLGLYAEDDWRLGAVVLTGGLRADRWSIADGAMADSSVATAPILAARSGWNLSLRGGTVVRLSDAVSLRASAYSGLRQPTLNELYRSFTLTAAGSTTRTLANPDLANERLEGFELGLDLAPVPGLTLSATLFDNRVRQAIANVTTGISGSLTTRKRFNVDAVRARGLEAGAELRQGAVTLSASLALTRAALQSSGIAAALNGLRPAQTPRVAASATAAWAPAGGAHLSLTLRHVGAQYEDDLQTDLLPAATTLDAYGEWPLRPGVALVLRAENLAGVTVITRKQGDSADLGAPRTLWAGVKVRLGSPQ